jgi:hypothetical protein
MTPDRSPPRDELSLCAVVRNSWTVAIDNLSYLPSRLSDAMCRLATGGGICGRSLYTNADELVYFLKRPQITTGIPKPAGDRHEVDRGPSGQRGDPKTKGVPGPEYHPRETDATADHAGGVGAEIVLGADNRMSNQTQEADCAQVARGSAQNIAAPKLHHCNRARKQPLCAPSRV